MKRKYIIIVVTIIVTVSGIVYTLPLQEESLTKVSSEQKLQNKIIVLDPGHGGY